MRTRSRPPVGQADFETTIGTCRIAWSEQGITSVALVDTSERGDAGRSSPPSPASSRSSSHGAYGAPSPPWVRDAVERIKKHLRGSSDDLKSIAIDMEGIAPFFRRVYEAARSVGPGETVSYAELAEMAGSPKAVRAVGQALAKNPFVLVVPCHRVLASGGKLGGFSAPGGLKTKMRLLEIEREAGASVPLP